MTAEAAAPDTAPPSGPLLRDTDAQVTYDRSSVSARTRLWLTAAAVRLASWLVRTAVTVGRIALTVYAVVRLGLVWRRFCGNTGLADKHTSARTTADGQHVRMRTTIRHVPRLSRIVIGPHGWRMRAGISYGQDLDTWTAAVPALRHAARAQTVKVRELPEAPGFLEVRVLRRDPLARVTERPRPLGLARFITGATENGDPAILDFDTDPHVLIAGASGSGKSGYLAAINAAIAPSEAGICWADCKWGLEAEPWRARCTQVATTQPDVLTLVRTVLDHAGRRAGLLAQLGVRSVPEAATVCGVHLRRMVIVIDEIAELTIDHGEDKIAEQIVRELLSAIQRVRALGIHFLLCGQRFGTDQGKGVTSIRAQAAGRVCLRVNDRQTAEMVLPGMDPEVHNRVMQLRTPGMQVVQTGQDWHHARCSYLTTTEIRAIATTHTHRRISWTQLAADDTAALTAARTRKETHP